MPISPVLPFMVSQRWSWYHCRQCDTSPQASSGQYFKLLLFSGPVMSGSLQESRASLGFPVLCYLPEFAQTHIHWVSDAIQPSQPVALFSCPQSFPASECFQWVSSLHQVVKVLELQLQDVLPMNIQGWFPLGLTSSIALLSKGLSRAFSNTTVLKYQFFGTQPSLWSSSHIHTWLLEKP